MVEVEDLEELMPNAKGFRLSATVGYDETIMVLSDGKSVGIATADFRGATAGEGSNEWWVSLNKDETIALARHLLNLAREMD